MEKRIEAIETQLISISKQIRTLDDEIMRMNRRIDEVDSKSILDEEIEVENGEKHKVTVRKILIETYSILEPVRLYLRVKEFISRWKTIKYAFWFMSILFFVSVVGFTLTGQGILEIIGILK